MQKRKRAQREAQIQLIIMPIEPFDLITIALFTGVGNAIGYPIGAFVWRKITEHLKKTLKVNLNVQSTTKKG